MDQQDLPLSLDVAEINREAQMAVDRVVRARVELASALENLGQVRATIAEGSASAVSFIDDYLNPTVPNPEPVAPEVADTELPPEEEIPVWTDADDEDYAWDNTSGGSLEFPEVVEEFIPFDPVDVEEITEEEVIEEEITEEVIADTEEDVSVDPNDTTGI